MTIEEAVTILECWYEQARGKNGCLGYIERYVWEEDEEAFVMAIKALKAQESYELKNELPNHFSNACDLCVHKNVMCNICMTADKWEPKKGE